MPKVPFLFLFVVYSFSQHDENPWHVKMVCVYHHIERICVHTIFRYEMECINLAFPLSLFRFSISETTAELLLFLLFLSLSFLSTFFPIFLLRLPLSLMIQGNIFYSLYRVSLATSFSHMSKGMDRGKRLLLPFSRVAVQLLFFGEKQKMVSTLFLFRLIRLRYICQLDATKPGNTHAK